MSTIFYTMCGEGLGHSARAISLIEYLPQHDFHIFTYGDGYKFITDLNLPNVKGVYKIHGLEFVNKKEKISIIGTAMKTFSFLTKGFFKNKNFLYDMALEFKPDLFLVDWEPIGSRIANQLNIPCISVDSQHKFRFDKLIGFPLWLKMYSLLAYMACRLIVPKVDHYILSTFQSDLIPRYKGVTLAQCFVRKAIADIQPTDKNFLLVYVRQPEIARKLLDCIFASGMTVCPVVCYGVHLENEYPHVIFKKRSYIEFSNDLSRCKAVFTTGGIQLIGEARYYGKPSFVVPIPGQYEQEVNVRYVNILRLGTSSNFKDLSPQKITEFLNNYKDGIPFAENGVFDAIKVIDHFLKTKENNAKNTVCIHQ